MCSLISIRTSNFFQRQHVGRVQFVVFETSAYLYQIAREIVLLTKNHVQETTLKLARRLNQTLRASYIRRDVSGSKTFQWMGQLRTSLPPPPPSPEIRSSNEEDHQIFHGQK